MLSITSSTSKTAILTCTFCARNVDDVTDANEVRVGDLRIDSQNLVKFLAVARCNGKQSLTVYDSVLDLGTTTGLVRLYYTSVNIIND